MRDVTPEYLAAVNQSQVARTVIDVYENNQLIYADLQITEGNHVTDDVDIRMSATFTCNDPKLTPSDMNEVLMPGNEIRPRRGIVLPDGTPDLYKLGVLGISDTRVDDSGDGYNLRVDTYDRGRKVSRARMPKDWVIANNANVVDEIDRILSFRAPGVETNFPELPFTMPSNIIPQGEDPWEACRKMAESIGYDLFFDENGLPTLVPVVDTVDTVSWEYTDDELSTLIYIFKQISDERSYSRVVVTGESTSGVPVRAEAIDDDPNSPTYIYGPFGDVPYFMASSFIRTFDQAQAAAQRQLIKVIGFTENMQPLVGVNMVHEVGDAVHIKRELSATDATYTISKITTPLVYERGMNLSGKLRRVL